MFAYNLICANLHQHYLRYAFTGLSGQMDFKKIIEDFIHLHVFIGLKDTSLWHNFKQEAQRPHHPPEQQ